MEIVYSFWENNSNLWFNSTPEDDKYIYDNFNDLLSIEHNINYMNKKEWTSYCILYDQLLKHINRYINNNRYINTYSAPDDFIDNCYLNYNKFKDELTDFLQKKERILEN